ncbi:MAG: hypothetical protein JW941_07515 [Candidatus Coatesbacteria bacterium]|nr:hypothetical protein [Candidatus Coatesbacteria bacterium]
MELSNVQEQALDDFLEKLKLDPLANPILLADLTQLRPHCDFFVSLKNGTRLKGILSVTKHLPLTAIAFSEMTGETFVDLMGFALELPQCKSGVFTCLASDSQRKLIKSMSFVKWEMPEFRYDLPGGSKPERGTTLLDPGLTIRDITTADLAAVSALYDDVPAIAFGPTALELGPWVGVFSGKDLVGVSGVHFSTPWVTELGHAATHSKFRRMGCARTLLVRQIEKLAGKTEHITACCFQENPGPQNLLESLGFERCDQAWLMEFSIG